MGILFVIFIHLAIILVLASFIALFGGVVAFFKRSRPKGKRRIFVAIVSPFVGLYAFYFLYLIGASMVGMWKDVDMGIGDAWYVPLSEDYRLLFIDIPEQAFIEHKDSTVLDNVSHVFQSEDKVYCETWDSEYYMLNTTDGSLRKFDEVLEFRNAVPNNNKPLTDVNSFYYERRDAIAGIWFIIAAVLSAGASVWVVYTLHRLIIGKATATS